MDAVRDCSGMNQFNSLCGAVWLCAMHILYVLIVIIMRCLSNEINSGFQKYFTLGSTRISQFILHLLIYVHAEKRKYFLYVCWYLEFMNLFCCQNPQPAVAECDIWEGIKGIQNSHLKMHTFVSDDDYKGKLFSTKTKTQFSLNPQLACVFGTAKCCCRRTGRRRYFCEYTCFRVIKR